MEEGVIVPSELPLLPLHNQVLLPAAFAKVGVSPKWRKSAALMEHLMTKQGRDVLVAVVPVLQEAESAQRQRSGKHDLDQADLDKLHGIGTAARVISIARSAQSGEWVATLEGRCRVRVGQVQLSYPREFLTVAVEQLELQKDADGRFPEADLDREAQESAREVRAATHRLLAAVQRSTGSGVALRLAAVLDSASPGRGADLLAALLAGRTSERAAVLAAVDVGDRLRLALGLVQAELKRRSQELKALQADSKKGDAAARLSAQAAAERQRALLTLMAAQRGLQGPMSPQRVIAKGEGEGEEEEEEELSAMMKRLRAANPPAEVLKVAGREMRRLRNSNEQHPGHAMARAYLETLADLPWNSFAAPPLRSQDEAARLIHPAGSTTSVEEEPGSEDVPASELGSPRDGSKVLAEPVDSDAAATATHLSAQPPLATPGVGAEMSLAEARALLDEHHYGLDKIKQRIVQYMAVRRLRGPDARAPILCFMGPPGVGKTSLARSVAAVLGRPFHRISLGGVRDEAEVRGHRRTYIGAMPGRIIQGLRRVGVRDPVLLLDEVDKVGRDAARGDPTAALLEVLDPEQNASFVDTYLALPFDLSRVVFLATGNSLRDIPPPLLDRLEVITLSGYTVDEKVHIALRHLIPQQLREHGLAAAQLTFPDPMLRHIVQGYTREAGVRSLSRALAAICRHIAVHIVSAADDALVSDNGAVADRSQAPGKVSQEDPSPLAVASPTDWYATECSLGGESRAGVVASACLAGGAWCDAVEVSAELALQRGHISSALAAELCEQIVVDEALIEEVLGPVRFGGSDAAERVTGAGSVAGLVWTQTGGQVQYVECCRVGAGAPDRPGRLTITGQVCCNPGGEVLEESARLALSWIRAHAQELGLSRAATTSAAPATADAAATAPTASPAADTGLSTPADTNPAAPTSAALPAPATAAAQDATPALWWDVHLHLPAGAVPKDGPSAGITLAVALVSLMLGRCVRPDTAMTGELTLRGLVLPVGGVKEKLLAAHQAGIRRVIIPARNVPDVKADLPKAVRDSLEIIPVDRLEAALRAAFDPPLLLQPRPRL